MKKPFVAVAAWAVGGEQSALPIIKTPREGWVIAGLTFFHYVLVWAPLPGRNAELILHPRLLKHNVYVVVVCISSPLECWLGITNVVPLLWWEQSWVTNSIADRKRDNKHYQWGRMGIFTLHNVMTRILKRKCMCVFGQSGVKRIIGVF